MYCKFKVYNIESGAWSIFGRLTFPLTLGDTLTADTSSAYSVTLYFKGNTEIALESLTPGTICQIDFRSRSLFFVIIDGGRIEPRAGMNLCYHSYTIQEMLCYAREIYIQSAFFSNGLYDVPSFFTRLFALSESDMQPVLSTDAGYNLLVENWQSSDFQVASNSLLDNLVKIGQNNQVRFKARITPSTWTFSSVEYWNSQPDEMRMTVLSVEYKNPDPELYPTGFALRVDDTASSGYYYYMQRSESHHEYYVKSLKGDTVLSSINGRKIGETKQYLGANYASRVVANVENMGSDQEFWFPEDSKTIGMLAEPENNAASVDSRDNLVLVLPYNIRSASELRVIGLFNKSILVNPYLKTTEGVLLCDTEPELLEYLSTLPDIYNGVYFRNITGNVLTVPIVEQAEWIGLDPDDKNNSARHKMNTLYYKRGENKIYNIKILFDDVDPNREFHDYSPIYYTLGMQPIYQEMFPEHNFYVVKCHLYYDGVVRLSNSMNTKRTSIYSQEENLVSGKSLIANMQNYIDSMQNADEVLTYEFDSIDDMPRVGSVYCGKVIANINFECTNKKITATMTLSDELVKKSEYLSADAGLDLPSISADKAFDRITNYTANVWFCRTSNEANTVLAQRGINPYLTDLFAEYALDGVKNGRELQAKIPAEILLKTGEEESNEQYSALGVATRVLKNTLFISWATRDSVFVGPTLDKRSSFDYTDMRYYYVAFILFPGLSKKISYKILADSVRTSEELFPAVSENTFETSDAMISIEDLNHYHDPAERIKAALQINYGCYNKADSLYSELIQESSLLKDTLDSSDEYDRYVKVHLDDVIIQSLSINKVSDGVYKVELTSDELTATQDYYNVIIYRKHKTLETVDDLLKLNALVRDNSGFTSKSVVFYVAFTN